MLGIFLELGLPTADTNVHNSRVLFASHWSLSCNQIIQWFTDIAVWSFYFMCFFSFLSMFSMFLTFTALWSVDYGLK